MRNQLIPGQIEEEEPVKRMKWIIVSGVKKSSKMRTPPKVITFSNIEETGRKAQVLRTMTGLNCM